MTRKKTESRRFILEKEHATLESVDDGVICLMRMTLALSALIIIYLDPLEPDRHVRLTYTALIIYFIYSAVLYLLAVYRDIVLPNCVAPWLDTGCFLVLISLSSGTSSVFFFFLFFSVLVASFRGGFTQGIRLTAVSSLLFTIVGYLSIPPGAPFELNRFLLRPVYLLVLGYLMAYWGGREIKLKQRLSLLREITKLSNPRFGVSYTNASMLQKLQLFYDADSCLLVMVDPLYKDTRLFRLTREQTAETVRAEQIPKEVEDLLLSLPDDVAVIRKRKSRLRIFRDFDGYAFDLSSRMECTAQWQEAIDSLASKLELEAFVSVPLRYRGRAVGRLYVTAHQRIFSDSDIGFLLQVVEQILPVIHNIRLLSRMAVNAAEQERQRLARDLHDSVIQPYIGLQYKLAALRHKSAEGEETSHDIERLFQATVNEVKSLRGFVRGLREGDEPGANFISSVRRFASQFAESYDLEVQVESPGQVVINDRLAAELIRIVHEGLSNIRKHTDASHSKITVESVDSTLRLCIENNNSQQNGKAFVPRSITERTEELGGRVQVEKNLDGQTAIKVEIPL